MALELRNLVCERDSFRLEINVEFSSGAITTIVGKSGAGKTSLLYAIAGFLPVKHGHIIHKKREIQALPLEKRNVGIVFQDYALFSHMTVYENIAYGLKVRKTGNEEMRRRVVELVERCSLGGLTTRMATELSGGQQQRVAIARALAYDPDILLCDEALGSLEGKLRQDMQLLLQDHTQRTNATVLYVTHDRKEALSLGDHILGINDGTFLFQGKPEALYQTPKSSIAAGLLGDYNEIWARVDGKEDKSWRLVHAEWGILFCRGSDDAAWRVDEKRCILVRPEKIRIAPDTPAQRSRQKKKTTEIASTTGLCARAKIISQRFHGQYWVLELVPSAENNRTILHAFSPEPMPSSTCMVEIATEDMCPI